MKQLKMKMFYADDPEKIEKMVNDWLVANYGCIIEKILQSQSSDIDVDIVVISIFYKD